MEQHEGYFEFEMPYDEFEGKQDQAIHFLLRQVVALEAMALMGWALAEQVSRQATGKGIDRNVVRQKLTTAVPRVRANVLNRWRDYLAEYDEPAH